MNHVYRRFSSLRPATAAHIRSLVLFLAIVFDICSEQCRFLYRKANTRLKMHTINPNLHHTTFLCRHEIETVDLLFSSCLLKINLM